MRPEDTEAYWLARGADGSDEGFVYRTLYQRKCLRVLERELSRLHGVTSILEAACGRGSVSAVLERVFPEVRRLAFDLSPVNVGITRARFPDHDYRVGRAQDVELPPRWDGGWALVVCTSTLMHISPPGAALVLRRLAGWSTRHVVTMDWDAPPGTEAGGYCFAHDYASLYRDMGVRVDEVPVPRWRGERASVWIGTVRGGRPLPKTDSYVDWPEGP